MGTAVWARCWGLLGAAPHGKMGVSGSRLSLLNDQAVSGLHGLGPFMLALLHSRCGWEKPREVAMDLRERLVGLAFTVLVGWLSSSLVSEAART